MKSNGRKCVHPVAEVCGRDECVLVRAVPSEYLLHGLAICWLPTFSATCIIIGPNAELSNSKC